MRNILNLPRFPTNHNIVPISRRPDFIALKIHVGLDREAMNSLEMLFEVVRPWPVFLPRYAGAFCTAIFDALRLVNRFLVPSKVIHSSETLLPGTARDIAYIRFLMSEFVFTTRLWKVSGLVS